MDVPALSLYYVLRVHCSHGALEDTANGQNFCIVCVHFVILYICFITPDDQSPTPKFVISFSIFCHRLLRTLFACFGTLIPFVFDHFWCLLKNKLAREQKRKKGSKAYTTHTCTYMYKS